MRPERALPMPADPAEGLPETLEALEERAGHYFRSARSSNTVKAYRHDLSDFATWCKVDAGDLSPLPAAPKTVALYVGHERDTNENLPLASDFCDQ